MQASELHEAEITLFLYCSNIYTKMRKYKVRAGPEIPVRLWFTMEFFCFTGPSLEKFQDVLASVIQRQ